MKTKLLADFQIGISVPLNKETKSKQVEIRFQPKWRYKRALINKQLINKKTDIKRKSRRHWERREPLRPYEEHTDV